MEMLLLTKYCSYKKNSESEVPFLIWTNLTYQQRFRRELWHILCLAPIIMDHQHLHRFCLMFWHFINWNQVDQYMYMVLKISYTEMLTFLSFLLTWRFFHLIIKDVCICWFVFEIKILFWFKGIIFFVWHFFIWDLNDMTDSWKRFLNSSL